MGEMRSNKMAIILSKMHNLTFIYESFENENFLSGNFADDTHAQF